GFGGAAGIRISAATLEIAGSPTAYTITAIGTGGDGATGSDGLTTGGIGGDGGDGTGGGTLFEVIAAAVQTGLVGLDSQGFGGTSGNGGVASSGTPSAGGISGNGFGGTAALTNTDTGGTAFGAVALGDVTLNTNGNAGISSGVRGTASFGRIDIKDNATAPGGSLGANSILAVSIGTATSPGITGGIFVESAGDPLNVTNSVGLFTSGAIGFTFSGNGSLVAGGTLSAIADGNITATHAGQPATPVDSIVANGIVFDTRANFSTDAASRIRSASTLDIDALGNIAAGNLFSVNRVSAGALGNITLGNAAVTGTVSPPFGGPPTNGVIELRAGIDPKVSSGTFQPADITITGNVSATGHILAEAGNDIIVATGANILSDNRITFRSGDDILVRTGAVVRAANNPLPEFGYGVTGPLDEPALLAFDAGAISVSPSVPGNVAAIIVDGTIGAPGRAVTLTGGAIQADANAITAKHFYANIRNAPLVGTPANNDSGQLRADCVAGNICLGTLTVSDTVAIGPLSGAIGLPNRVAVAGNVNALDASIRARDAIVFGTAGAAATINGTNRLAIAA
ncbi:MAG: beta strand repeat-containing protein, partial [Sphingomonadaceae bacterium]